MRILLAEDDRIPLEALKSLLTKWGHDVVACSNGLEAWQILQRDDAPTMAILDWVMPGLEGVDICRKVRELPRNEQTYLILLTGKGSEKDIVTGLEAGADDYVVKPFNREELWARVREGVRFVEIQQKLSTTISTKATLICVSLLFTLNSLSYNQDVLNGKLLHIIF